MRTRPTGSLTHHAPSASSPEAEEAAEAAQPLAQGRSTAAQNRALRRAVSLPALRTAVPRAAFVSGSVRTSRRLPSTGQAGSSEVGGASDAGGAPDAHGLPHAGGCGGAGIPPDAGEVVQALAWVGAGSSLDAGSDAAIGGSEQSVESIGASNSYDAGASPAAGSALEAASSLEASQSDDDSSAPSFDDSLSQEGLRDGEPLLEQEVLRWHHVAGAPTSDALATFWEVLDSGAPETDGAQAFGIQLERMHRIEQHRQAPADFAQRVVDALTYLQAHPAARNVCFAIAVEGAGNCEDRVALSFLQMEEAIINDRAIDEQWPFERLAPMAQRMQRSGCLMEIARVKIASLRRGQATVAAPAVRLPVVDATEIMLGYWVCLSGPEQLNLPSQISAMRYASGLTQGDIAEARQLVLAAQTSESADIYLSRWPPFEAFVRQRAPRIVELTASFSEATDAFLRDALLACEPHGTDAAAAAAASNARRSCWESRPLAAWSLCSHMASVAAGPLGSPADMALCQRMMRLFAAQSGESDAGEPAPLSAGEYARVARFMLDWRRVTQNGVGLMTVALMRQESLGPTAGS